MTEDRNTVDQSPYQQELKMELNKINTEDFVHAARLINEEVKRVDAGEKYKCVPLIELHHDKPSSNAVKVSIPIKQYPYNFVGKLLGPKGNTLKQLQQATQCKLSILGKGSMRDKVKEEELRKEGGKYAHLNEDLHVMIECFAETVESYNRIAHAITEIKKFMLQVLEDGNNAATTVDEGAGGYYNGEGMGRGGGAPGRMLPPSRGAPAGRGGLLSTPGGMGGHPGGQGPTRGGMNSGRGSSAPRGGPVSRGGPVPRGGGLQQRGGGPGLRGGPAQRGPPPSALGSSVGRGAPAARGMTQQRGLPSQRGPPPQGARGAGGIRGSRGGAPQRGLLQGRGGHLPSQRASAPSLVQDHQYDDYGLDTGLGSTSYDADPLYGQESRYEDSYGRRDPYVDETAYEEPIHGGGDTQYFDYGHGASVSDYQQEYEPPRSSAYDRAPMKQSAPIPSRNLRGTYRAHPYDVGRPIASQGRLGAR